MSARLTNPPKYGHKSLLYSEVVDDLDNLKADIAVLGIPYGSAYSIEEVSNDQSNAPTAIRQASDRAVRAPERYDFDIGGPLLMNKPIRMVDCGDVINDPRDLGMSYRNAEAAVRKILKAGALPIILGGDHGIPIPVLRAYDDQEGPITLIHVDAHLDWRQEVNGVPDGYSSPIRRISEMDHVKDIYQIGIRAQGSARQEEVDAAYAYGANIVTAYELHDVGMDAILERIPAGGRYYITLDADGMDPSVMPAVNGPALGGVTYHQARKLIHGLVNKGRVVGMDLVEITPAKDVNRISSIAACRLFVNLIGATIKAGYYER
ncbi:agmatinase [Ancylobacter sp. MQZ15Z-1]|uniref:Agmatinase n=1 Tax=Ancylobacter mangrovi TaxID=2972472 RepID=A0A9X2PIQ9_9HYPH|nr:agmatinase [Ancylobacter mangrovi]MCS0496845.1 agmatinase [Ancylobacter mangrovi]